MRNVLIAIVLFGLTAQARASNYALEEIPQAIPPTDAAKLKAAGVATTFALLEKGGEPPARKALSKQTHIKESMLEQWIQMADLLRVKGIGPDVARLLSAAGVKTVAQLKSQDAKALSDTITKINDKDHLSQNPPSVEHLDAWIKQAQTLPIVLK
jgi:predicted flap endonuclease-1-like 5' DNA nuclease